MEKSDFIAPAGWQWDNLDEEQGWEIKPELSVVFEPDEGHSQWQQEAFEHLSRETLQNWPHQITKSTWLDSVIKLTHKFSHGILIYVVFFLFVFFHFCIARG